MELASTTVPTTFGFCYLGTWLLVDDIIAKLNWRSQENNTFPKHSNHLFISALESSAA